MDGRAPLPRGLAIGIDVGGTKIAGGVVDLATGRIAARQTVPTRPERGGAAVLADVITMANGLRGAGPLAGLGLGVAELVSPNGQVFSGYRIAWNGWDLAARLADFGPVRVESDVRAAALAEAQFGAGRGLRDLLFVTIGTGISAVSVRDGVPYAGSRGAALVIANGPTLCLCPVCGHAETDILEDVAAGPALALACGMARAEDVLASTDPAVLARIDYAAQRLGGTVALLVGALDPAAVIVGGGLGSAPGRYWDRLQQAIRAGLWDGDARTLPIRQAALGADAGLIGAALSLTQEPVNRPDIAKLETHKGS